VATAKKTKESGQGGTERAAEKRIAHAVNHPVRLDGLSILFERLASPKEIAGVLKKPLGTVSFHVGELVKDGAIELVKTAQRRGAVEHYYRAKLRPEVSNEEMRALPKATRRKLAGLILQGIVAEGLASLRHGKMETDDDLNLIWLPMHLSDRGQDEVAELQAEMLTRLEAIKAGDEARPKDDTERSRPVRIAAMMWFERAHAGRDTPDSADLDKPAR
jgi:DNA-binding transcriptional ArsR family regulator